ncbi:hypothetical protein ROHU_018484 [Labeo rohita]|uniref:Uncharacterized protein n=1 Tax=Labeo rohita TaxID=84645 RepID=A0A498LJI1_LABRO|nr:hypothetical protein ROHU_031780 [Labeo rohita]RXN29358.1 hypothetical protein ROHU_018484 [Labeo rohita]
MFTVENSLALGHGSDATLESPRTSDLQRCCDSSERTDRISVPKSFYSQRRVAARRGPAVESVTVITSAGAHTRKALISVIIRRAVTRPSLLLLSGWTISAPCNPLKRNAKPLCM